MALAIQAETYSNDSQWVHLDRTVVKDAASNDRQVKLLGAASFLRDFEAVVHTEMQKSVDCIALIKQDIAYARTESQVLRKQLHWESSAKEQARILNKIAANKTWIAECGEHIVLINQRALVLQEQLVSLQNKNVNR